MTTCSHIDQLVRLQPPKLSQSIHREECTQCFDDQDSPLGIDVCLTCFNGGCLSEERHHALTHYRKSGHQFTVNVKRKLKPSAQRAHDEEPPAKMTKLAIIEEREEDKYEFLTTVKCWKCEAEISKEEPKIASLVSSVMQSLSSARQSEVKAWEEEIFPCEHTLTLDQFSTGPIPASGLAHCSACDLKENLWLCLTCGSLGCGRQQYGGTGGNGHGLAHFDATQHPVSVKLGTITPEGNADIHCYVCNDAKLDPSLATHLAAFGINVKTQEKTEKSMTELQIEHNLKYDFSLTSEDGKALQPVFGPGLTGLKNLGNSCYMASVLQTIFALSAFQERYQRNEIVKSHAETCPEPLPADCVECQMHKVADGLLSGRYAKPASHYSSVPTDEDASTSVVFQDGLRPSTFKTLVGKGHDEFSTMRQQDSEEFLGHLITILRRDGKKYGERTAQDPTQIFAYANEQRLQCTNCKKVRYRVDNTDVLSIAVPAIEKGKDADGKTLYEDVTLWSCIEALLGSEVLEGYSCPSCGKPTRAVTRNLLASFPEVLVVHAKKFQLVNWVPAKLDIPLILPEKDMLELGAAHLGTGLKEGEQELPEDKPSSGLPEFNEAALDQLQAMGFPLIRCQKALIATGNSDPEAAMEWLFGHMEDPDIDAPIQVTTTSGVTFEASPEQISMLTDMGFSPAQAKKALRETGGDMERAVEWLFSHPDDSGEDSVPSAAPSASVIPGSKDVPARYRLKAFISHKGPSVHSGHYVAHIRTTDANGAEQWVLYNDEKVVKADDESVAELKKLAYLYFFEKA